MYVYDPRKDKIYIQVKHVVTYTCDFLSDGRE